MLARLSRERRTGKGGEPKQGSHGRYRREYNGSCTGRASRAQDTAGGHFLMKKSKASMLGSECKRMCPTRTESTTVGVIRLFALH
ncbi:unnamed protein product [Lota lota]